MKHSLIRFSAAVALSAMAVFGTFAQSALAGGGGIWTDISDKIAERQNRPMWAMARAEPFWYMTDGQELWSGGHVWKTEGSIVSDITTEVRNAGLSRVDDIVSDGQTVLFLKNVTAKVNIIEVVAFNGAYTNLTNQVRQYLQSNEGIISIRGNNGVWAIVTSLGRVVLYTPSSNTFNTVAQQTNSSYLSAMAYSVRHASPTEGFSFLPVVAEPVANGWLIANRDVNTGAMRILRYNTNGGSIDITSQFSGLNYIQAIASNGSSVLIAGSDFVTGNTNRVYVYDGVTVKTVTNYYSSSGLLNWNHSIIANAGSTWIVMSDKRHYFINDTTLYNSDVERDYFITVAGSFNGVFLAGGAVSNDYVGNAPSTPLTLKLVKIDIGAGIWSTNSSSNTTSYTTGGSTYTSNYGPTITTSGNPSNFHVTNGNTFNYHANASDVNGVDHIDLYVNNALIKTCYADTCDFSSQYFSNGLSTRAVPLQARATDRQGNTTTGGTETLNVDQYATTDSSPSTTVTNNDTQTINGTSFWSWFDPNQTRLRTNQIMNFNLGAWDADGLNQIQIYVNGNSKKICNLSRAYGNQICMATLYGSDYAAGSSLAINASITDGMGKIVWVPLQYLSVTQDAGTTNAVNGNTTSWIWSDPEVSTLNASDIVNFYVGANDPDGIRKIEILANGVTIKTCDLGLVYGNQTCSYRVTTTYQGTTYANVSARITDGNGSTIISQTKSYTINNGTGSNTTNGDSTIWTWTDPNTTSVKTTESVRFWVGAWDAQGIRRIDIIDGKTNAIVRSCDLGYVANGNQQCSMLINGANFAAGVTLPVTAKVTDGNGNTFWSQTVTYTFTNPNSTNNTNTTGDTTTWDWLSPNVSSIKTSESIEYGFGAWDPQGIRKIELLVNGSIVRSCDLGYVTNGNQQCVVTLNGASYSANSSVTASAKITDGNGNVTWSNSKTFTITSSGSIPTFPINLPGSVTITSNHDTGFADNETISFAVNANDQDGIKKVEILVNGELVKTCTAVTTCGYTGGPYNAFSSVSYGAKLTDNQNNALWTGYKTIYKK